MTTRLAAAALLVCAAACREDRPPAPTTGESAQLNEMESALNDLGENEEGPEQRSGPSNSSEQ